MALYAIGDLHLSLQTNKSMDIFGSEWHDYVLRIKEGFSSLCEKDVTVLCGDISWAMELKEAKDDFLFIDQLPGKKYILKGNHDYWWTTAQKMQAFFDEIGVKTIKFIHNNCYFYGENAAICGTRGWFYEQEKGDDQDKKIMNREIGRLETSLKLAGDKDKYVFLHYPPKYGNYECTQLLELLKSYEVKICVSGHIHAQGLRMIFQGMYNNVLFKTVSADFVGFRPQKIME